MFCVCFKTIWVQMRRLTWRLTCIQSVWMYVIHFRQVLYLCVHSIQFNSKHIMYWVILYLYVSNIHCIVLISFYWVFFDLFCVCFQTIWIQMRRPTWRLICIQPVWMYVIHFWQVLYLCIYSIQFHSNIRSWEIVQF